MSQQLGALLGQLARLGVTLEAAGDQLRVRAAKGVLTDELRASLAKHKASLLVLLEQPEPATVTPVSRDRPLPLSFAQQRLWFLQRLEPDIGAYNIAAAVQLEGHLDVTSLERSFDEVIRRHEALRTT